MKRYTKIVDACFRCPNCAAVATQGDGYCRIALLAVADIHATIPHWCPLPDETVSTPYDALNNEKGE